MRKWNTGKKAKAQFPTEGAHWSAGRLTIDGTDAKTLTAACIARGLLVRGVEVFKRDESVIHKNKL